MENAGNIGSRRREGKKYAVEDEALDRIAKEVSVHIFKYKRGSNSLPHVFKFFFYHEYNTCEVLKNLSIYP